MSASLVILERFDSHLARLNGDGAPGSVFEQRLRAEAFAEGYAAGEAAAGARVDAEARFLAAVAAALDREAASAPQKLAKEAGDALTLLLIRIFPTLTEKGFAAEAAAIFARALKDSPARTLEIKAPAERVDALKALIERRGAGAPVEIIADPALAGAVAAATWSGGGLEFDLDAAARDVIAAFDSALQELESEKNP